MKIRNFLIAFNGLIILLTLIMSSCRTTNRVVSSNFIQKRKYNNGYYITAFSDNKNNAKNRKNNSKNIEVKVNPFRPQINNNGISAAKNDTNKGIQTNNSYGLLAATDDNTITKQEMANNKSNVAVFLDNKNFNESHVFSNRSLKNNKTQINNINPSPIDKSDDGGKLNGMALAGFICGLLSLPLMIVGTLGGTFFFPAGIICLAGGIILSILGYKEIKNDKSKGKWFAIAGLAIEILAAAFVLFFFLILPQISQIG